MLLYTFAIFLSAFLLFQIQPLIGKYILPWFGGTPAVWSTSMLFFQVLLLAGYAYSYSLIVSLSPRKRAMVHISLISISLILLAACALYWPSPITPGINWRPSGENSPIGNIFIILVASVGLPYFLLATNSPLIQAWFNEHYPERSPYWLYALSNAASLLALITYPVLIEPALSLRTQGWVWTLGYVAFAVLLIVNAVRHANIAKNDYATRATSVVSLSQKPAFGTKLLWVCLSAVASVMLLAVTSQITQEVAVTPFLWVLPLAIYLLSFILTFSYDHWYWRGFYSIALFLVSILLIWMLAKDTNLDILFQIAGYSILLFVCCMFCHGELVRLKPSPNYLTSFYLMVSLGGVIGGIFVNLIAPYLFTGFWELQLGVIACWVLLFVVFLVNPPKWSLRQRAAAIAFIVVGGIIVGDFLVTYLHVATSSALAASRNFYGVLRVRNLEPEPDYFAYQLTHGATAHGFQYIDENRRRLPTAYYTESSGIGLAIGFYPQQDQARHIGILGLGIGTIATYGQQGDHFRFYEINPAVIRLAQGDGGYFSFLSDCPCLVDVVAGDARISLENELSSGQYVPFDIMVLDTFNSDSIPTHLLTSEAFDIYLRYMKFDGVLALHVSNRQLDLLPVVRALADSHELDGVVVENPGDKQRHFQSTWVILSRDSNYLMQFGNVETSYPLSDVSKRVPLWTDDYNNLFQILK